MFHRERWHSIISEQSSIHGLKWLQIPNWHITVWRKWSTILETTSSNSIRIIVFCWWHWGLWFWQSTLLPMTEFLAIMSTPSLRWKTPISSYDVFVVSICEEINCVKNGSHRRIFSLLVVIAYHIYIYMQHNFLHHKKRKTLESIMVFREYIKI